MTLGKRSFQSIARQWIDYLMSEGMDSITYFIGIPFLFDLTQRMTDDHHTSTAITNYGVLLSIISLGRFLGREYQILTDVGNIPFVMILMNLILILIIFSNNYIVVLLLFVLKEYLGAYMSRMYTLIPSLSTSQGLPSSASIVFHDSNLSNTKIFTSDNNMKRNLTVCIFSVLLASMMYSDSDDVRFPCFLPFLFIIIIWDALIFIYLIRIIGIPFSFYKSVKVNRNQGVGSSNGYKASTTIQRSEKDLENILKNAPSTPQNFIDFYRGNQEKARKMFLKSLEWRFEYDVDNICNHPQQHFHEIMRLWPHGIHGRSRDGCVVLYEILGRARPRDLMNAGITLDDLLWHFNLRNEFIFQKILVETSTNGNPLTMPQEPKPVWGQIMTVVDIKGISFMDFSTDVISFIKQNSDTIDNYYPLRVKRLIICNVPSWFSSVWGAVTSVLPQAVRDKIRIIRSFDQMDEVVEPSQRPLEYGGTGGPLGTSPEHLMFLDVAAKWEEIRKQEEASFPQDPVVKFNQNASKQSSSHGNQREIARAQGRSFLGSLWWSQPSPTQAYLGQKNSYRYDEEMKAWTLDADDADDGSVDSEESDENDIVSSPGRMRAASPNHLEEHGLLLAIHAAHLASKSRPTNSLSNNNLSNLVPSNESTVEAQGGNMLASISTDSHTSVPTTNRSGHYSASGQKASLNNYGSMSMITTTTGTKLYPDIFLVSLGIYISSSILLVGNLALLPLWMMLPTKVGGLGYSVLDMGLIISTTSMILLLVDTYLRDRLLFILKSSPLRMLRIATATMAIVSVLLPLLLGSIGHDLMPINRGIEVNAYRSVEAMEDPPVQGNTIAGILTSASRSLLGSLFTGTPKESAFYLVNPSILLSVFVCSAYMGRKASTMLLQIALSPAFVNPLEVVRVLGTVVDVMGPALCCLFYRIVYDHTLHHSDHHGHLLPDPLNLASLFSLSLVISSLLYCTTFMLKIQFRGDFGVMPDHIDDRTAKRGQVQEQSKGSLGELLNIISEDMRLLLSPPKYGYGSKLYNLKIDIKDL